MHDAKKAPAKEHTRDLLDTCEFQLHSMLIRQRQALVSCHGLKDIPLGHEPAGKEHAHRCAPCMENLLIFTIYMIIHDPKGKYSIHGASAIDLWQKG